MKATYNEAIYEQRVEVEFVFHVVADEDEWHEAEKDGAAQVTVDTLQAALEDRVKALLPDVLGAAALTVQARNGISGARFYPAPMVERGEVEITDRMGKPSGVIPIRIRLSSIAPKEVK